MLVQTDRSSSSGIVAGIVVLVAGVLIGALLEPFSATDALSDGVEGAEPTAAELLLQVPVARPEVPSEPPVNDLETLRIELDDAASQRLQAVHDRSMKVGRIAQRAEDLVPATVYADGKVIEAKVRIKGDFLDHIDTDKWSLRVELKSDKLWGMSRFSIQHPKTRSYLWEWLFMRMARKAGILAPRAEFVNVVMNDNSTGVYYLEEHFTKELLESQGVREGPILRFVEDTWLDLEAQYIAPFGYAPAMMEPSRGVERAPVAAYGEKRLNQSENLSRQLEQGLEMMRTLQKDRGGRETHNILDLESNAALAALSGLFRSSHDLVWKSRRYYHNPVTARLEPIAFDVHAGYPPTTRDPLQVLKYVIPAYLKNEPFYQAFFLKQDEISGGTFLNDCLSEFGPPMQRAEQLMRAEGLDDPLLNAAEIEAELRRQQVHMQELLHPRVAFDFDCRLLTDDAKAERPKGILEVEAWATTRVPVVLEGFQVDNGPLLGARWLDADKGVFYLKDSRGSVVLPTNGEHVVFRFRSDREREAVLRDVDQLKSALLSGGSVDRSLKMNVKARVRLIVDEELTEVTLPVRKFGAGWSKEGGRPKPPAIDEALEEHGFLQYDPERRRLELAPGTYDVEGDLIIPDGYALFAGEGTVLRFGAGKALITSSPLQFEGTAENPIVLEPQIGVEHWGGVAVLKATEKSLWRNVHVYRTDAIRRGGWMMTGGVNFFRSTVDLYNCRFEDARGEDALNIFGVDCLLDGVVIDTVASDAFDGDFVTGLVVRSQFKNSVEDAVDVSGSSISVQDCHFAGIGDKAISAGEDSEVEVLDCVVESASIAVASKDFSRVEVDGLDVQSVINYGFAVYIKKAEFGPSTVVADNVQLGFMGRGEALVQDTCALSLNGVEHESVPVDVGEMYRQKILGQ